MAAHNHIKMTPGEPMLMLEHIAFLPFATFGRLIVPGWACYTIEQPAVAEDIDDIPALATGVYPVSRSHSETLFECTAGEHDTVVEIGDRMILPVSTARQTLCGVIGVGADLGTVNGQWALTGAAGAFSCAFR